MLVMCVVLEMVLCAPILEFESVQSLEEVSTEIILDVKIIMKFILYFNTLESSNMHTLQGLGGETCGKKTTCKTQT